MNYEKGTVVRLKSNVSREGTFTGQIRNRAGKNYYQIQFPDRVEYKKENEIEVIPSIVEDPYDLFFSYKFSEKDSLNKIINHIKFSGKLLDTIYSLETTDTEFLSYQYLPLLKILKSPSNGLLIADEVGLGKTIEAGLIWNELKIRYNFNKLMVVCPAMLRNKWKLELSRRFGINAQILNKKDVLDDLQNNNDDKAIISSYEGLRPSGEDNNELIEFIKSKQYDEKLIDLLIVDEAHYAKNPKSKTNKFLTELREVSDYILLLSATPIQLKTLDLFYLLRIIDNNRFYNENNFNFIVNLNRPIIQLRNTLESKVNTNSFVDDLQTIQNHDILKNFKQLQSINLSGIEDLNDVKFKIKLASKLDSINFLNFIINRTRKRDVIVNKVVRDVDAPVIQLNEIENKYYQTITKIIKEACKEYEKHEGFLLVTPQRQMSSSIPASFLYWKELSKNYNITDNDENFEFIYENWGFIDKKKLNLGFVKKQIVSAIGEFDYQELHNNDSKFKEILKLIKIILKKTPSEKIVIFSYFKATINYLNIRLSEQSINSIVLQSGVDKESALSSFQNNKDVNILLSTEVGSEGIDLQFAKYLINYDLPWNPMKIEQRIGRIDRIGQKSDKIKIINLFYDQTIDSRIYKKLYERLNIFQNTLGNLEVVLGEEIQNLANNILFEELTADEEEKRIEQTALAIERINFDNNKLEEEASSLIAHHKYILESIEKAHKLNKWINDNDILLYVKNYLTYNYPGTFFKYIENKTNDKLFQIDFSSQFLEDYEQFIETNSIKNKKILYSNHTSIHFLFTVKTYLKIKNNQEVVNITHPLIKFIYQKQKDSISYPALAIQMKESDFNSDLLQNMNKGLYIFIIKKWWFKGLIETEKLFYFVKCIVNQEIFDDEKSELIIKDILNNGSNWNNAKYEIDISKYQADVDDSINYLDSQYEEAKNEFINENHDKIMIQQESIETEFRNNNLKHQEYIERYKGDNKEFNIRMEEGKLKKLKIRFDERIEKLDKSKDVNAEQNDLCLGILNIRG
jgi:SNF2 family DNA or RNA helicase